VSIALVALVLILIGSKTTSLFVAYAQERPHELAPHDEMRPGGGDSLGDIQSHTPTPEEQQFADDMNQKCHGDQSCEAAFVQQHLGINPPSDWWTTKFLVGLVMVGTNR
jgi:hypothetical protein